MHIRVAVGQFPVTLDITRNFNNIKSFFHQVDSDELLILPEGALSGYEDDISFLDRIDLHQLDDALRALEALVKQKDVHLIFGSCLHEDERWFNAGLYFSPEGKRFVYRKVNLATHERGHFAAGSQLPVFSLHFENVSIKVGMQLCREIRYPEQWRYLAQQGAEIFVYLTNAVSPQQHLSVWRSHLISRAAENQRFVISANTAHPQQHCPTMIISPVGEVLQEIISDKTELIRSTLHLPDVTNWYLSQCRDDIVGLY
ncbi:MAG TPA: carbon-nitrogen hydrolase family protein [Ktedonobacteraceae bacterium]|nr:carbon-nitrogen hydrolase family protein [Ktedonobacteraceae bacterium]